jgi:hypothetical protein
MHNNIRDAILLQMYKTYQVKYPDDDSYIDTYKFPFLYIHSNESINHLTQPHGTQSPMLLDELSTGGYLRKDKCDYYLTKKALEYIADRSKTAKSLKTNTQTTPSWQDNILKYFILPCAIGIIIGVSVLYY